VFTASSSNRNRQQSFGLWSRALFEAPIQTRCALELEMKEKVHEKQDDISFSNI
jgi:hypothetical protein